jgi:carbon monoxide dehydrogenase subunit G
MQLQGEHTFTARSGHVWELLNDPDTLARITPGLSSLEAAGEDSYRAQFAIKMGPINSTFSGTLRVVDRVAPERFRLLIDIAGNAGSTAAEATVTATPVAGTAPEQTRVTFAADARLTGLLVRMGQRVISGVGRLLTKQFFQALERELRSATPVPAAPQEGDS